MRINRVVLMLALALSSSNLFAQGNSGSSPVFEGRYLEALSKIPAWVDSLDAHFDAWIQREKSRQGARRVDRFAKALYRLCSSKDELTLSVVSPFASVLELQSDAEQVRRDLEEVRNRFQQIGETIARADVSGGSAAVEGEIRNGLSGKAILVDQLVYQSRLATFDRQRFLAAAKNAGLLCRQSQQAATLFAARHAGS